MYSHFLYQGLLFLLYNFTTSASILYSTEDHQLNTKVICFPTEVSRILVQRKDEFTFVQIMLISAQFLIGALGSLLLHAR